MKRMVLNQLAVWACLFLCFGCSSVKPAPEPSAVTATSPDQKPAPATHSGPTTTFVDGWLKGQAPPPDFSQGGGDGNYGWTFIGMILQCAGTLLVNK